jgi:hypothetical protein
MEWLGTADRKVKNKHHLHSRHQASYLLVYQYGSEA